VTRPVASLCPAAERPSRGLRRWFVPPAVRLLCHVVIFVVSLAPVRALAAGLVDQTVIEATEAARMAVRAGSLEDRIISQHVELITSALLQKQRAQFIAMRNMIVGIVGVAGVFGFLATISTRRAETKLREQEMEIFGEFRSGSAEVLEDEDEEEEDSQERSIAKQDEDGDEPDDDDDDDKKKKKP